MPRNNTHSTPTKSISPPARRTRSAVKKRQNPKIHLKDDDVQEQSLSTPQTSVQENPPTPHLSSDTLEKGNGDDQGIVIDSESTRKLTRSSRKKVTLPPLPSTPVPPPPPSAQKTYSTRKRQKESQNDLIDEKTQHDVSNDLPDEKLSQTEQKEEKNVSLRSSTKKKRKDDSISTQDAASNESSTPQKSVMIKETPKTKTKGQQNEEPNSSVDLGSNRKEKSGRKRKQEVASSIVGQEESASSASPKSGVQARKRKKDAPKETEKDVPSESLENETEGHTQKSDGPKSLTSGIAKNKTLEKTETATPEMKVNVHRFRNANYIPRGILRLCSTPYAPNSNHYPQLAVSREGGAVELVSVNEKWKCIGIVEGMKNRNVDAMAWVCGFRNDTSIDNQPNMADESETESSTTAIYFSEAHKFAAQSHIRRRLFGASRDGTIFEVDFKTKRHRGVIGSGGGAVFCLVSLCPCCSNSNGSCGKLLAAGCEDGSVRIYRAKEGKDIDSINHPCLELISTLPSVGSAVISVAWLPGSGTSKIEGSIIYVGAADGTIRKFHCSTTSKFQKLSGSAPHAISTGAILHSDDVETTESAISSSMQWKAGMRITLENRGSRSATKVWAVLALSDGTVVSGDSLGNVQFWDGNAGTLLHSFEHNPNNGDVFDLAVSYDQTKVMASGIDSKVICIERVPSSSSVHSKWVLTSQQRSHTHDVNSLALVYLSDSLGSLDGKTKCRELLCSGGLDTKVCSYFVANMRKHRAKVSYKYPAKAPICLSRGPRILSIMRPDKVDFYQLAAVESEPEHGYNAALNADQIYLGSVGITSNFNLISFDVSDDGKFMALSHSAGLMVFNLEIVSGTSEDGARSTVVVPKKVDVPSDIDVTCSALKFGPDYLLCATVSGCVNVIRILNTPGKCELTKMVVFDQESQPNFANGKFTISDLTVSANGKWFATARNSLGKGSLQVFSVTEKRHWWTLPCTESPQSAIKFLGDRSSMKPVLAVACNSGAFYLFDVERRCLTDWSEDLGFPAGPNLPMQLMDCPNCPENLLYNCTIPNKFVMGGHSWFCSIDLSLPVPLHSKPYPEDHFTARNWRTNLRERHSQFKLDQSTSNCHKDNTDTERYVKSKGANTNFTICLRYSGIIFQDYLSKNEMVIVEQPWLSIVNHLPDALERQRYGS